jgi:DnaJ-class molecular chaperone
MTTDEALAILRLKAPTTWNVVKTRYRQLSKIEHPDVSKHPEAIARFARLSVAMEFLRKDPAVFEDYGGVVETETGDKLADLGKGLGPTTNGSTCGDCDGKGYRAVAGDSFQDCTECRRGIFGDIKELRCGKCSGTGVFMRGGRQVGKCFACDGSGWRPVRNYLMWCKVCGTRGVMSVPARKRYYTCEKCKGSGELPMWNPVLAKGLLSISGGS